ncbi:MAG: hypothetical protein WBA12_03110, partial [Catalinimonas sp.]
MFRLALLFFLVACLGGCRHTGTADGPDTTAETTDTTRGNRSPEQVEVRYATGFHVTYHGTHKVLHLHPDGGDTARYALLPKGAPEPTDLSAFPAARRLQVPVERLVALSSTHAALTDALGANEVLVGLVRPQDVS